MLLVGNERATAASLRTPDFRYSSEWWNVRYWHLADITLTARNVRYWDIADIPSCTAHVRFRGKADMTFCAAYVRL